MVLALLCVHCTQQKAVGDITPLQTLSSPPNLVVVNSSCASTVLLYQRRLRLQTHRRCKRILCQQFVTDSIATLDL